jgi:hypothetical protein
VDARKTLRTFSLPHNSWWWYKRTIWDPDKTLIKKILVPPSMCYMDAVNRLCSKPLNNTCHTITMSTATWYYKKDAAVVALQARDGNTLTICKIRGFHSSNYEEYHLLGCYVMWLFKNRCFRRTYRLHHQDDKNWRSVLRLLVTATVVPSPLILVTLMMVEIHSSKMSVLTSATWRNIPEGDILH